MLYVRFPPTLCHIGSAEVTKGLSFIHVEKIQCHGSRTADVERTTEPPILVGRFVEGLRKIGEDIFDMLQSDRQTNITRRHTGCSLFTL